MRERLEENFELTVKVSGSDKEQAKEVRVLNRILRLTEEGVELMQPCWDRNAWNALKYACVAIRMFPQALVRTDVVPFVSHSKAIFGALLSQEQRQSVQMMTSMAEAAVAGMLRMCKHHPQRCNLQSAFLSGTNALP